MNAAQTLVKVFFTSACRVHRFFSMPSVAFIVPAWLFRRERKRNEKGYPLQ